MAHLLCGLVDMVSYTDRNLFNVILNGWEPETAVFNHTKVLEGRSLRKDDKKAIMLGTLTICLAALKAVGAS